MKKRLTLFLACLFLSIGMAMAQMPVKGVVTSSEDGQPIIGASVKVVGTSTGTITDTNGRFSLNVPNAGSRLEFSYIGMLSKTLTVKSDMNVVLDPENKSLDEVVVVAFGTQTKSAFTGSATFMNSKDLQKHVTTNVANALVGNVSGLQMRSSSGAPGAGAGAMNIRGISSLYAGTDPLIIVDGAPYTASLSNIPQGDIESVSVLKDAASAALYGARGASGVIIVTTKKGKSREAVVNVDVKWGANTRAVQEYDVLDSPAAYYESYYTLFNNYAKNAGKKNDADANLWANQMMMKQLGNYNVYTLPEGQNLIGMDGHVVPGAKLGRVFKGTDGLNYYLTPDNWTDMAYKSALRQDYNVSVSGSTDRSSFYVSAGYLNEDGIIEHSSYDRFSSRIKADYQAKKWLKLGANVAFVHSNQLSNPNMSADLGQVNLMYYTSMMAPIYPIYVRTLDKQGNPVIAVDKYGHQRFDYGSSGSNGGLTRAFMLGNPIGANQYNEYKRIGNQLNGNFFMDVNITDYLKFNMTNTVIWGQTQLSDYGSSFVLPKSSVGGELTKSVSNTLRTNFVQTLTFFKEFNKHDLNVMLGHEYYKEEVNFLEGTAKGNFSPDIKELAAFATKSNNTSYKTPYNVEGYFGNVQYNYDKKYYGSVSYRYDATSHFAKEHRWGSFWSLGGAWIMNKESFLSDVKWLNVLKLKASVGQQGNDNIGNYAYTNLYRLSKASETAMSPKFWRIGNPEITWETTTNFNVGVEFDLWQSRLTGNIDFYSKKTTDLLFWLSVPESMGSRGYYGNVGDIRNSGVEANLTGAIIRTKDIDWTVSLNFAHNKGKILKLPASKVLDNGGFLESPYWYEEGGEMLNYMTYAYAGVDETGQALYWYDEDMSTLGKADATITNRPGKKYSGTTTDPNKANRYAHGSNAPDLFGGFSTNFRFGNFDLSLSFDYQLGGKVYDARYQTLMTPQASKAEGYNYHKDYIKAWSATNTTSNIPRWQYKDKYAAQASDRWLTNASYLNFQSFTVGYTLPKNLVPYISNIRIYAAGENLYFWSKRKGLDPRYAFDRNESVNVYSPVRNISGGVQLTF